MDSSSAARSRVAVATAGVLLAGIVAATAVAAGAAGGGGAVFGLEVGGDAAADRGGRARPAASAAAPDAPVVVDGPPVPTADAAPPSTAPAADVGQSGGAPDAGARRSPARPASPRPDGEVKRPPPRPSRTSEAPDQQSPSPAAPTAAPTAPPPQTTARYAQDFPDPFVYRSGPHWYAVSTQRGWSKVPLIRSVDLVHWEEVGDALAALPRWSRFGGLWAPSVLAVDGGYVLFYATTEDASGLQCLSSGFSVLPEGPFVDASTGPLLCQRDRGGSIDPSPFRDAAGRPWLTWKSEGTIDGEPTRLWSRPLTADGRSLAGDAVPAELLVTGLAWEGPIVEAPSMFVGPDGAYHLLYSGNRWETSAYGVGHARCAGPAGPCARSSGGPVASAHPSESGAGGAEAFFDGSAWRVAYHAWDPSAVGYPGGLRRLRIGEVRLGEDGSMRVEPVPR